MAKIVSVNIGAPREVAWRGDRVMTGIYKSPVEGRIAVGSLNLEGDAQADLNVHGGRFKAIYCYPYEHYDWWKDELRGGELPLGVFGENLTTEGLDEPSVHIGDQFSIGNAHVIVTQPRLPCYKLGIRFDSDAMVKRFLASGRTGFYLGVQREGTVAAGDAMTVLARDRNRVSIADLVRLYVQKAIDADDIPLVRKALRVEALSDSWKTELGERLARRA